MTPLPHLDRIPPQIATVADYAAFAKERLSEGAWAYLSGGAGDEWTLRENVAAFARYPLCTRVLRSLSNASTEVDLFGQKLAAPILLAPLAFQRLAHPDGEVATAIAASALDTAMVVSTQASMPLETIAEATEAPVWFQLYMQHDRAFTETLVRRAEAAGYQVLVVTLDSPVNGMRNREQRAGFTLPADIDAVNLRGLAPLPPGPPGALLFGTPLADAAPTWEALAWLRSITHLPIVAKGVAHRDDARQAIDTGMNGIIVSNHGGRSLDGQRATIDLLPAISAAVGGQVPILLDGGVRRGTDVLRAIALGASAVLIGRPYIFALAAAGSAGVAHVLRILRGELELAMALTGCTNIAAIDSSILDGRA